MSYVKTCFPAQISLGTNDNAENNTTANIYLRLVYAPSTSAGDLISISSFNPYSITMRKLRIQSMGLKVRLYLYPGFTI